MARLRLNRFKVVECQGDYQHKQSNGQGSRNVLGGGCHHLRSKVIEEACKVGRRRDNRELECEHLRNRIRERTRAKRPSPNGPCCYRPNGRKEGDVLLICPACVIGSHATPRPKKHPTLHSGTPPVLRYHRLTKRGRWQDTVMPNQSRKFSQCGF